jgi:hypothetical protein
MHLLANWQLWAHKIHHSPDSREATTFPHIVFYVPPRSTHIWMAFYHGTPKEESRNCHDLDSYHFAGL